MANDHEQLVQQIADQVIAALRARGATPAPGNAPGRAPQSPAPIHPPVGVCTGDYSKFTELQTTRPLTTPRQTTSRSPQRNAVGVPPITHPSSPTPQAPTPALKGFVTAHQLEAAIKAAPDGVATLAADARLTPLAADFARHHPAKVRRASQQSHNPTNLAHNHATTSAPWLWWADAHCPAVQSLTADHRDRLRPATAPRTDVGLVEVVSDLARLVAQRRVQGGLLFVRSAARPICYANRCKNLRAVVGTCAETVDEAVRELGANVLVIEYPYISPATMSDLLERMLAQTPDLPANVARHLTDLHCR
ncbi:hypothetical protein ACERK3_15960 [Phycisphaerales bacterium AB-hyl4]|uniref:Uncharacterized protein n=1 Tax=Natronomicrosphaera hydrolytica TaxID=3242702 RepID=A0ABV4U922_9BACT